jgi:hypothetical protein
MRQGVFFVAGKQTHVFMVLMYVIVLNSQHARTDLSSGGRRTTSTSVLVAARALPLLLEKSPYG